jgi:hypothetical protein
MLAYAGFIFFSLWHRIEIWDRNREGVHWHSMSFGVSHLRRIGELPLVRSFLPFLRNDWILYCWIEPGLCLAVAVMAIAGDQAIGLWLLTASLALWLKNQLIHSLHRSHVLQLIDSAIEAEYFNDAVEGKPKTETAGFSVSMPGKLRLAPGAATRPNAMADTVRQVLRPEHMAGD